jgi:nucleotide-binding universal stress UspA family protein
MYKRMLVPLDGSELAELVFPFARELAGQLGTEVTLLHISNQELKDFQPMTRAYVDHAADLIKGSESKEKPVVVKIELVSGYPPDEILRYTDEKKQDLILMASHGRSGRNRWGIGSVADKVLRSASVPVLLVPAVPGRSNTDKCPIKELIVPLDGSEMAEIVLSHVEGLVGPSGMKSAKVVFLRACEPPSMPTYYSPELSEIPLHWGQYAQQETTRCKQVSTEYLGNIVRHFKDAGIDARFEVLTGKASDEIVNYATKNPNSLIVMATHGRSGLSRLVYGSVALNILIGVTNPILLIKPANK